MSHKAAAAAIAFAVCTALFGQRTAPAAEPTLKVARADVFAPAPAGSTVITGRLGDKLDLCINQRLVVQDVQAVVAPYQQKAEAGSADWRCEYWGKWYTSLESADAYKSTEQTRELSTRAVTELIHTAAPDGYLGTRQPAQRLQGWDVWGRKYALLGLMSYYDRTGDISVLQAAKRHTDTLIKELGPGGTNIEDVGEWNGLPASSVLEPVVQLYERSNDTKYLDFAEFIVASWDKPSRRLPGGMRLVEDAIAGKAPSKMCAPKAYEMMSCFEGLCELYRATGNEKYKQAAVALGDGVFAHECNLVGCGTSNEVWDNGTKKQTGVVPKPLETCVTATWMKLNYQLLRMTGDVKYADELERNLYNGLLGAMMPDGRWWAYFSGLMGPRVPSYVQHADVALSCCVVNGPRGLMITPFWAYMQAAEGPVVNLYAPGSAVLATPSGHKVSLIVTGDYPVSDQIEMTVGPEQAEDFTLSLRIPTWSEQTTVRINGDTVAVKAGTYAKLKRTWHAGDRVTMKFDLHGRVIASPSGNGQIALARGPVVLAIDSRLNTLQPGQLSLPDKNAAVVELKPNTEAAAKIGAWMAFDVVFSDGQSTVPLTFCDFASAGNAFSQANTYRTWLPEPFEAGRVFQTRQTWQTLSHAPVWTNPPASPLRVKDAAHDLALASAGATASADSEYAERDSSVEKVIDGIISGPTDFETHRWHSSVETPHPHCVAVKLARPATLARAVIDFADPAGYAVTFEGQIRKPGQSEWVRVFRCEKNASADPYVAKFEPVEAGEFRLVIEKSASEKYPNAAQVSEIELYATP